MVFSLLAFVFSLILIWKLREFWILLAILVGFTFGQLFTVTPTLETTESLIAIKISNSESKPPAPSQSGEGKSPAPSQSGEGKSPAPSQSGEGKSPAPSQSVESKSPAPSQSVESKPPAPSQSVESKSPAPAVTENLQEITELCLKDGQILIGKSGNYECTKSKEYKVIERSAIESARQQVLTTQILEIKRNVNRLDAASALPESTCRVSIWKIPSKILCEIIELPYRLPTFLFRPFPLIDSGSSFLNLAGIENLLWLGLVLYAAFAAFKMNLNCLALHIHNNFLNSCFTL
jgi:hypothetical protein